MRTIILGISCLLEIIFIVFCISNKSNHTPAGYCCIFGGIALLIATIILMLFPKYELPKPTGKYIVGTFDTTYSDSERLETYSNQNENRWLNVKLWFPDGMEKDNYGKSPLINFKMLTDDRIVEEHIFIKGAGHMTLTDLAYSCPPLTIVFGQNITLNVDKTVIKINSSILQFFDTYLK